MILDQWLLIIIKMMKLSSSAVWALEFVCERQLAEEDNYVLITLWSILVLFDFKIAYNHALPHNNPSLFSLFNSS